MLKTILSTKSEMSQMFIKGVRVPVTWIKADKCTVSQIKKGEKDGYFAIQLAFGEKKKKNLSKSVLGHLKSLIKSDKAPKFIKEIRLDKEPDLKVGDKIDPFEIFKVGDLVSVTGISKGKGFAGVVKRWKFAGGPKTHGQSDRHRAPGSIGQRTTPGRVYKGKRMAGRMGSQTVTVKNLIVVSIDKENGLIGLSGPVPGIKGGLLTVKKLASGKLSELTTEGPSAQVVQTEEVSQEEKGEVKKEEISS
ncbi:MAG: 50S ribosomal protein L3 [Patescibacteria group bacterium]|nr:MAG: 50S ribosomal protein L3 [Patescibacteria group bacterium]